jgi:hypothetical protein
MGFFDLMYDEAAESELERSRTAAAAAAAEARRGRRWMPSPAFR